MFYLTYICPSWLGWMGNFQGKPWFASSKFAISGLFWPILRVQKVIFLSPEMKKRDKFLSFHPKKKHRKNDLKNNFPMGKWPLDLYFWMQRYRTVQTANCALGVRPHHQRVTQRPKKSELSGWQLSTRKNFPDEVRKSFLRQKKPVSRFCDKRVCVNCFCNKKVCWNHFCNKKVCVNCTWTKKGG